MRREKLSPGLKLNERQKYFIIGGLAWVAVILILWIVFSRKTEYVAMLEMESDAMSVVNYYSPRQIKLSPNPVESSLILPTLSGQVRFGGLVLGNAPDSIISIALDFDSFGNSMIYVDKDNNEDLTDDDDPVWDETTLSYMAKEILIDANYIEDGESHVVPYPVSLYRYRNKLKDTIVAYRNGYRKGVVVLQDSLYRVAIFDDNLDGRFSDLDNGAMVIDLNRDDILNGEVDSDEYISLTESFSVAGQSFRVKKISDSGHRAVFVEADTTTSPGQVLTIDSRAPEFRMHSVAGQMIDLRLFRNKVVLLDFWASWCKPWEENLIRLKQNYARYNKRGFEIIGLNLDYDIETLRQYLTEKGITWPQISDGRGWDLPLVDIYRVKSLPKSFLVDRNGVIRYKDLQGKNLEVKIFELLNEPEVELEGSE